MLIHSFEFIFVFLPIVFTVYLAAQKYLNWHAALVWLICSSLFFYAQLSVDFVITLIGSVVFNYTMCRVISGLEIGKNQRKMALVFTVSANLLLLGYYKYTNFFIENLNAVSGASFSTFELLFPIGISFYTFIQIGYVFDTYNNQVKSHNFTKYFLFSTFFPYITAGPLVLQREMLEQFDKPQKGYMTPERAAICLTIFSFGLFKKIVFADGVAPYANLVFGGASEGALLTSGAAWIGSLAYTLQLYFDFSGYCDMVVAVGLLFGFQLPINFNSPLKATSIVDFWHRWHMTMTRFFTTYLYSPLAVGLMRKSMAKSYGPAARFITTTGFPVLFTFTLAGLWHGAGWNFVIFGIIHGVALAGNHAWKQWENPELPPVVGWLLTMFVVVVALVFFRASSVADATTMLQAMFFLQGIDIADPTVAKIAFDQTAAFLWILVLGLVAVILPNTMEVFHKSDILSDQIATIRNKAAPIVTWQPNLAWALGSGAVSMVALGLISRETTFLYYQF